MKQTPSASRSLKNPSARRAGQSLARVASKSTWRAGLALVLGAILCGVASVDPSSAARVLCGAALVPLVPIIGWRVGEYRLVALRREVRSQKENLRRALTGLEIAQAETVRRLSMAVEFRDEDTGAHIERIGRFSTLLAEKVGMDPDFCKRISHAAPLHDVGKVAIPDSILLKPGPLTAEERAIVETHAEEGYRLLRGSSSTILDLAATIALSHHERWDGTGYPRGVAGEQIPIEGRIVAIADVFDALTSDRVYREAFTVEEAIEMMQAERGHHFDPTLVDVFLQLLADSLPAAAAGEDPARLTERARRLYWRAIQRADGEAAESVIATAVEHGAPPARLHSEVLLPALEGVRSMADSGQVEGEHVQLAIRITRRVLATLYRYMLGATEPHRERLLLAGIQGDDHGLVLRMIHDQLAAAGFRTTLYSEVTVERLNAIIERQPPDMVVIAASVAQTSHAMGQMILDLHRRHPDLPVLAGGEAAGRLPRGQAGLQILHRLDETVPAIEHALAGGTSRATVE